MCKYTYIIHNIGSRVVLIENVARYGPHKIRTIDLPSLANMAGVFSIADYSSAQFYTRHVDLDGK